MKGLRDLWVFSYFLFHWFFFPLSRSFVISSSSSPSTSSFVRRRHHCQHCRPRCHCQTMVLPPPSASPRYPFLLPFLVLEVFPPLGYVRVCGCVCVAFLSASMMCGFPYYYYYSFWMGHYDKDGRIDGWTTNTGSDHPRFVPFRSFSDFRINIRNCFLSGSWASSMIDGDGWIRMGHGIRYGQMDRWTDRMDGMGGFFFPRSLFVVVIVVVTVVVGCCSAPLSPLLLVMGKSCTRSTI